MFSGRIQRLALSLCLSLGVGAWIWLGVSPVEQGFSLAWAKGKRKCVRYSKRKRCVRRCLKRRGRRCVRRSRRRTCKRRCLRWKSVVAKKSLERDLPITSSMSAKDRAVAGIQNYYKRVRKLCANFQQVFKYARIARPQKESGRFYFRKPGKMRMYYTKPEPKDFIYNGIMRTLWVYFPEDKEVKVSYNQTLSQVAVAIPFLRGDGDLRKSFTIREHKKRSFGKPGEILLELTPKKPQTVLRKLYLAVDATKYLIRETAYVDPAGNRNSFRFQKLRRNDNCSAPISMFRFKKPKDVEQIILGQ